MKLPLLPEDPLALFDRWMRIEFSQPEERRQTLHPPERDLPEIVRFQRGPDRPDRVLYAHLAPEWLDAAIAAQQTPGPPLEWQLYSHDWPPELHEHLLRAGFVPQDEPGTVMLLDLLRLPASLSGPPAPEIQVRRLEPASDPAALAPLEPALRILEAVWGGSFAWMYPRYSRDLALPGYLSFYVAEFEGTPASVAWTYFYRHAPQAHGENPFVGLWGGSTLPAYRGRGLYTALLAARLQEAAQRGARWAVVDAIPASEKILRHHGFEALTTSIPLIWRGPREP